MKKEFLSCNIWTNEALYFRIFFYFLEEEGEPSTVSEGNDVSQYSTSSCCIVSSFYTGNIYTKY